jgi:SAM-dependent methyltransferase
VSPIYVELSGESAELARAEAASAAQLLGGHAIGLLREAPNVLEIDLDPQFARTLAGRLALAHRCLIPLEPVGSSAPHPRRAGSAGVFRRFRRPSGGSNEPAVLEAAQNWKAAGGSINLAAPDERFWLLPMNSGQETWFEEVASVDRKAVAARRISALPFQRPVGLDPRLARAAANLTGVGLGGRVVDPFLGTGALLAEAALLGANVVGIDRDPIMVQGALRNFAHLGLTAESMLVGDAGELARESVGGPFDAVLSDLPYGRASGTGGEDASALAARVLPHWVEKVRPGGRVVVVVPGGPDPLGRSWVRTLSVAVRVYRSLTREFRVYERAS